MTRWYAILMIGLGMLGMVFSAAPTVNLLYPINNPLLSDTPFFSFNVTADTSLVNCSVYALGSNWTYSKIDQVNYIQAGNGLMNSPGWSLGLENGAYAYYINCTDWNLVSGMSPEDHFRINRTNRLNTNSTYTNIDFPGFDVKGILGMILLALAMWGLVNYTMQFIRDYR